MSKGISGLFSDTKGSRAAASSSNFMFPDEEFTRYIQNRKDVDANGFYDVVAHGMPDNILVVHNGKSIEVSHRVLSGLLEHDDRYGGGGAVRLLSCSTGSDADILVSMVAPALSRD